MKIKIVKNEGVHFNIDVKRFYMPYSINWECPNCKECYSEDLNEQYLSHPTTGTPIDFDVYCRKCEHEDKIKVQLDIDLKIVN